MFSLSEIVNCSYLIQQNESNKNNFSDELLSATLFCWNYVCRNSDHRTLAKTYKVLWESAYFNLYKKYP